MKTLSDIEPAAHMYPWDLEEFQETETYKYAYSVAVGCPDGKSEPLFTFHDLQTAYKMGVENKPQVFMHVLESMYKPDASL
jgi:hypothetical protein